MSRCRNRWQGEEPTPYEIFDSAALYFVKMSGEQFLEAWNSGPFHDPDPDLHPGVIEVASIAPRELLTR